LRKGLETEACRGQKCKKKKDGYSVPRLGSAQERNARPPAESGIGDFVVQQSPKKGNPYSHQGEYTPKNKDVGQIREEKTGGRG